MLAGSSSIPLDWTSTQTSPMNITPDVQQSGFVPAMAFQQNSPVPTLVGTSPLETTPAPIGSWSPSRPLTPTSTVSSFAAAFAPTFDATSSCQTSSTADDSLVSTPAIVLNGPLPTTLEEWVAFIETLNF